MLETYPTDVKVVFKNYPLRSHRYARLAAAAALAAGKQGQFWEMHDQLLLNCRDLGLKKVLDIARELALDEKQLIIDFNSDEVMEAINRDVSEGSRLGVRGTPTVFVNGKMLKNRSFAGLQEAIAKESEKMRALSLK